MQAGWPFASIITAFAAVSVLQSHGWRPIMIGIGALGLILLLIVAAVLPESLSYLQQRRDPKALALAGRLRTRMGLAAAGLRQASGRPAAFKMAALFRDGRGRDSVLLWTAVTLGYFVLYFVISWIPKLAAQAGLALDDAIYAGATYNFGAFLGTAGVGALAVRFALNRVVAVTLVLAAGAMMAFGGFTMPVWLTLLVALAIGVTVQGGFNGFWALAARLYPAEMRGTGVGWALGVGRIGAVLGPIAGGLLVGGGASIPMIFAIFAVPLLLASALTVAIRVR